MYKIKLIPSIAIIFSLMVGISSADTILPRNNSLPILSPGSNIKLPKHYPAKIMHAGKITKVSIKRRVIVLDGISYKLHPVHDIYTKRKGRQTTLYNLKPGMKVALEFITYRGKRAVYKIWILPKNYPTKEPS